eukprot:TRINITY_DN2508_c0_g1_i1.p1 TRINITY_DN2508_c0_g1~~TRINITY_DN2508_c0_g1_i1.p1  ORF type:complete len:761 (-),score=139.73 TRINITY_DN2508_c0_g1_i1:150-2432(-)
MLRKRVVILLSRRVLVSTSPTIYTANEIHPFSAWSKQSSSHSPLVIRDTHKQVIQQVHSRSVPLLLSPLLSSSPQSSVFISPNNRLTIPTTKIHKRHFTTKSSSSFSSPSPPPKDEDTPDKHKTATNSTLKFSGYLDKDGIKELFKTLKESKHTKDGNNFMEHTKLATNTFPLKQRERTALKVIKSFQSRFQHPKNNSKEYRPLTVIHGAPGTGKSRFLDEFLTVVKELNESDLKQANINLLTPSLFHRIQNTLSQSVHINITFGGLTLFDDLKEKDNLETYFCLRLLHSYFLKADEASWDYIRQLAGETKLWFLEVIQVLLDTELHGNPLFIGVDEISHSIPYENTLLSCLTSVLDGFDPEKVNILLTTTGFEVFSKITHTYIRIDSVSLDRISFQNAISFFQPFINKDNKEVIERCVLDCGGHPRSLQFLYDILSSSYRDSSGLSYDTIMDELVMQKSYMFDGVNMFHVKSALMGQEVHPNSCIDGSTSKKTVAQLISDGVFINSLDSSSQPFTPQLSPFALRFLLRNLDNRVIKSLLTELLNTNKKSTLSDLIHFHTSFSILKRELMCLHPSGQYSTPEFTDYFECSLHEFFNLPLSRKSPVIRFYCKTLNTTHNSLLFNSMQTNDFHIVYLIHHTNNTENTGSSDDTPVDTITFDTSTNNEKVAICEKVSTQKLTIETILQQTQQLKQHAKLSEIPSPSIYHIFFSNQPLSEELENARSKLWKESNILFLGEQDLERFYTPTFAYKYNPDEEGKKL